MVYLICELLFLSVQHTCVCVYIYVYLDRSFSLMYVWIKRTKKHVAQSVGAVNSPTASLQWSKTLLSVLDITLNILMVRLQ